MNRLNISQEVTKGIEGIVEGYWNEIRMIIFPGLKTNWPQDKQKCFTLDGYRQAVDLTIDALTSSLRNPNTTKGIELSLKLFNRILPITEAFVRPLDETAKLAIWKRFKGKLVQYESDERISKLLSDYKYKLGVQDE